jgi:hypothetical protein
MCGATNGTWSASSQLRCADARPATGQVPTLTRGRSPPASAANHVFLTHEREWRIVDPEGFCFTWEQIAYVLVPDQVGWQRIATAVLSHLQTHAQMLAEAFDDQDPNVLSAEDDVRECDAALAAIPVKLLTSQPSRS